MLMDKLPVFQLPEARGLRTGFLLQAQVFENFGDASQGRCRHAINQLLSIVCIRAGCRYNYEPKMLLLVYKFDFDFDCVGVYSGPGSPVYDLFER